MESAVLEFVVREPAAPWGAVPGPTLALRRRPTFLPEEWLSGDLPTLPHSDLAIAGQLQLRRAAGLMAQLDLALGGELRTFAARGSVAEVGHSQARDFALERLGFSWSLAQELMLIERRLADLPALRAAFVGGALSRSKMRELMRVASPETDSGWAAFARGRSVRELKAAIAAWKRRENPAAPVDDPDEEPDAREIRWRCSVVEAGIWRGWGRAMMRDVLGGAVSDAQMAEAISAEMLTTCDAPETSPFDASPATGPRAARRRRIRLSPRQLARLARRRKLLAPQPLPPIPSSNGCTDAWEHLEVLRDIQRLRHGLAWERWRVLSVFQGRNLHRVLGLSAHQHVEHALGLAPKDVREALELQSRLMLLPRLTAAWREGELSEREVRLLARIATRDTEAAWIEHASRCARVRLEDEVNWHLTIRAVLPWPTYVDGTGGRPLDAPTVKPSFDFRWRAMFGVLQSGDGEPSEAERDPDAPWNRADARLPHVTMIVPAPASVARQWCQALAATRAMLGGVASDGECVHRMLLEFAQVQHDAEAEARVKEHEILERDGWRCAMPHCRERRALHVHHVRFRSRGGPDDDWNLVTLCEGCHRLLHAGRVAVLGRAPEGLVMLIGPEPAAWGTLEPRARERWTGGLRA